ncbi:MAG TPA: hypothetical protein VFA97_13260 [Gaiellaceae bacterium]|nr:hypothetical protein [Gaiellaceae bacterium]
MGLVVLLAAAGARGAAKPLQLAGTWSGHYGGAVSGSFTLKWTQSGARLSGKITLSNPNGTYDISGSVKGKAIHFGAVGVGATYAGTATSTSMSGTWKSPEGGGSWSATKAKPKKK